jgi:transposase-like protein
LQELASKYDVHPKQISTWKRQLIEGASDIFERADKKSEIEKVSDNERDIQFKTIGELKVANDFLKKKYRQLYGKEPF